MSMDFSTLFDPDQHVRSLTLVRHGRTAYNASGRVQGNIDIPLDEIGDWQVHQTGKALKALYVDRVDDADRKRLVVSSDLGRAQATAHAFADLIGAEVHLDPRVRERRYGDWEGQFTRDIAERYTEDFTSWIHGEDGALGHNVEPDRHVGQRAVEAITEWAGKAEPDTDLFVFSHGACIADTMRTLLGIEGDHDANNFVFSMRNAHWARLMPIAVPGKPLRWAMTDYNHGPAIADTEEWEHPNL
ncbi:histidine phosphatase family protein [Bifidobacterium sp. ESL0763]|uniref:histidine phosphatase family protein n=1 Tax=Bifidobacterium sp. ESL0763 TaxID=2983227 RepID=UPI0023F85305|nr:histidine phosphatase family protein [Bifidobacterium sp. ESL0763]MDF7663750.1 histidine phosphatase family protein [Bifidobacterium sp. ESL0763]